MKHASKANWGKGELKKLWKAVCYECGSGPRAIQKAHEIQSEFKTADADRRKEIREQFLS